MPTLDLQIENTRPHVPDAPHLHSSLQPIFRLPAELLYEIFSEYIRNTCKPPSEPELSPSVSYDATNSPFTLGQVCSRWRNVAMSFPDLWTTIIISNPRTQAHLSHTVLWLERSAGQPLDLTVIAVDSDSFDFYAAEHILTVCASLSHLWRKVSLKLATTLLMPLHRVLRASLPCEMLEDVHLYFNRRLGTLGMWLNPVIRGIWSIFYSSPSLRSVHWTTRILDCCCRDAPSTQLESITLDPIDLVGGEDVLHLISRFPNLHHLHAKVMQQTSYEYPGEVSSLPIVFQHLTTLHLESKSPISLLLTHITLPALVDLSLVSHGETESLFAVPAVFSDFLRRSQCRVGKFVYCDPLASEQQLHTVFTLPELRSLTYFDFTGRVSDQTASLFSRHAGDGSLAVMPLLATLRLGICFTADGVLSNVVLSRRPALKRYVFSTSDM
ncbi:unnamed protein product [Cyclocybe aegerita]|uniref:F-box domain-containing protein n=1 Tax=Cyclocybe aegerita TaxID=1973307 RepID=A0A8S0VW63_CYCAE|nr:unnamed protein product [Cyclocybe aegerita]